MPDRYKLIQDCNIPLPERLRSLEQETKRRFAKRELVLYRQPFRAIRSGLEDQYELLLRERKEDGTYGSAQPLILALEGSGDACEDGSSAIAVIDRIIIGHAIELLANSEIERLWVNVSSVSISHNGKLALYILRSLVGDRVRPQRLGIEAGEASCLDDITHAKSFFTALRTNGCPYALDDFGAVDGKWSDRSIKIFKPDLVKLDKNIVFQLGDPSIQSQIKDLIRYVHSYGGEVLAECVENELQAAICQKLGLDYIQGFYVGVPTEITTN